MIIREDAIYGRQSVDRKDSISIESQIEFCKYELRGGNFRKYTDKGYSGKNTDRPKFPFLLKYVLIIQCSSLNNSYYRKR